ncbi:hypothetical protein TWF128_010961 [Orbilia oligospora]|nr:hypothetical protein TWF128_010961 [Orbilia oligospora]
MQEKRSRGSKDKIKTWKNDVLENCIISQYDEYPLTHPCDYYTTAAQGEGVTVYIVDHAFAIYHQDFKHVSWGKSKDHIFADEKDSLPSWFNFRNSPLVPNIVDEGTLPLLRGTAVLSKLLGKEFGVARGVKPILVKTSDRFSSLEPDTDHIFSVLPKVLLDIKRKSAKFDVSKREAPKFIILIATDYAFERGSTPFGFHVRRLSQLIQELSEMPNVAVVTSDGNHFSVAQAPTLGDISEAEPIISYPGIFGKDSKKFPNLVVTGGTHPGNGELVSRYSEFIRISAPSVDINVAVPDGGKSWGGKKYTKANSTPLAAAAITGVLATLISAKDYTISEAIARVYKLAYPRRREPSPFNDTRVFPNVVYNGLSLLTAEILEFGDEKSSRDEKGSGDEKGSEDEKGHGNDVKEARIATVTVTVLLPRQRCVILRRAVTTETLQSTSGVATQTITVCERDKMPETTFLAVSSTATLITTSATSPPPSGNTHTYDAAFCKECLDSNGVTPIQGVLWIPKDCPSCCGSGFAKRNDRNPKDSDINKFSTSRLVSNPTDANSASPGITQSYN